MMTCWHLTLSSRNRELIFPVEPLRRAAVRKIAEVAGNDLVLFDIADSAIHLVTLGARRRAGRVSKNLRQSFRPLAATELQPSHIRRITTHAHLLTIARQMLDQPHHGLLCHPALQTGSCFADLVGARYLPLLNLRLLDALPRLTRADLFQIAGLPTSAVRNRPQADEVRKLGLDRLIQATAAALVTYPSLQVDTPIAAIARRCFAKIARAAGFSIQALAATLQLAPHQIPDLAESATPPPALHAVLSRIVLELAATASDRWWRTHAPGPARSCRAVTQPGRAPAPW